ncbi:MAG TPA: hypothetical protein VFS31_03230 [Chitinophagaceae bacterium]|nr:hypothetical protein [Chitinophagaceae bacterium]
MKNNKALGKKQRSPAKDLHDRHLDIPSEANRDKHINFAALENNDTDPSDEPATGRYTRKNDQHKENRH